MLKATEVKEFSLNFKTFLGKILKVTDGDTVKVAFKLTNELTRFTFRLNGVDTPESRSGEVK
jgi:endonuclease YncB( thermonuclease family)